MTGPRPLPVDLDAGRWQSMRQIPAGIDHAALVELVAIAMGAGFGSATEPRLRAELAAKCAVDPRASLSDLMLDRARDLVDMRSHLVRALVEGRQP